MSYRARLPVLTLMCAASFVAVVDTTIVTIALPAVQSGLQFSTAGSQWVLNGYAVVFGGLLLLLGRLGDRFGRRRLFEIGLIVFGLGSLVAGAATEPWLLVTGRFLQGGGAAGFVPASLSLMISAFPQERDRSRALAAYGSMAGAGFVVGMVGGGVITQVWGWRWVFLVNIPVVVAVLVGSRLVLTESRQAERKELDVAGAVLITSGLVLFLFALGSTPDKGWTAPVVVTAGALGLVALAAFVLVERRHPEPVVPLDVVSRWPVLVPNAAVALESVVGIGWLYVLTLYLQRVRGFDALETGLLFMPMTLASVAGAFAAGRAAAQWGLRRTAVSGLVLVGIGLMLMAVGLGRPMIGVVLAGMVVGEAGFMFGNVSLTIAATLSIEEERAGLAAGLLNTSMQLGGAVGLGVVAVVVASGSAIGGLDLASLRLGLLICLLAFCLPAVALVAVGLGSRRPEGASARAT
jgi:EmrB/QacA subfamily drug resistance transporter